MKKKFTIFFSDTEIISKKIPQKAGFIVRY